jgi:hypothetical protein
MNMSNLRLLGLPFALVSAMAIAAPTLQVSNAGLGDAKFGMNVESVEKALGANLSFGQKVAKAGVAKLDCVYARIDGVSGVSLRFEYGHLTVAIIDKPTVTTKSGFKVGDPESAIISKLKGDPTYRRETSPEPDGADEIFLGSSKLVGTGEKRKSQGNMIMFASKRGRVVLIEAGDASYLMMVEHDEDCQP